MSELTSRKTTSSKRSFFLLVLMLITPITGVHCTTQQIVCEGSKQCRTQVDLLDDAFPIALERGELPHGASVRLISPILSPAGYKVHARESGVAWIRLSKSPERLTLVSPTTNQPCFLAALKQGVAWSIALAHRDKHQVTFVLPGEIQNGSDNPKDEHVVELRCDGKTISPHALSKAGNAMIELLGAESGISDSP